MCLMFLFICFWLVKLVDQVRARLFLMTLSTSDSPLGQTLPWNKQLIIKWLCSRLVMLADQVRAAAASGHSQDLARLLANPDPNKFAPDLVRILFYFLRLTQSLYFANFFVIARNFNLT